MFLFLPGDVARSQASVLRKDCDDLKLKLLDYEKMSKFQKAVSSDSQQVTNLEAKVDEMKKALSVSEREKKSDVSIGKILTAFTL